MPDEQLTPPNPPTPPTPQEPAPAPEPTDRVGRAMAAELEALRRQLASVPDADELQRLRDRAALADQITADLPAWREQLTAAVDQQRQEGDAALSQVQQDLARARIDQDVAAAFFANGGTEAGWQVLRESFAKDVQRAEDGTLVVNTADGPQPLADALASLSDHPVYAAAFRARYGAGGGSRGNTTARAVPGVDVSRMTTDQRFKAAFGRNR